MSDSSKKFDFQGVLNNIKSMISLESSTPNPDPDDVIGMKITELSVLVQQLTKTHEEQAKELGKVNRLLNDLFKNLEALRNLAENKKEEEVES